MSLKSELPDRGEPKDWFNRSFEEMWNKWTQYSQSHFYQLFSEQDPLVEAETQLPSASVEEYPEFLLPLQLQEASAGDKTRFLFSMGHTEEGLALMCGLSKKWREIPGVVPNLLDDTLWGANRFIRETFARLNEPGRNWEEQKSFGRLHEMLMKSWVNRVTDELKRGSDAIRRLGPIAPR